MPIEVERYGDVVVVRLEDELVEDNVERLKDTLAESLERGCHHVVVDFDRTELIDSAGLGCLKALHDQMGRHEGSVRLSGLDDTCRKILEMTRLDRRFEMFGTLVDAVKSFR